VLPRGRAADEVVLDAVGAPDGTEVFFCRTEQPDHSSWTADFADLDEDGSGAGVRCIDHMALTQPWQFFDEATLFYRSVLALEPQDSLEVPDPYGLVRSRAVSSPDGAVRIALNVQPAGVDDRHAGSMQHVAFRSDDLPATARAARAAGADLLPISGNYYDDLEARLDLDPALLRELRELGVLYDRDQAGEFLQLFTATRGEVFFEVVQRLDGYDGYGAANAAQRLAAQH
jgi:4-hydroxyphenylpyruvate dioxygenase